jgi:alpha-beta hydrolase superfamily lysophospholipase
VHALHDCPKFQHSWKVVWIVDSAMSGHVKPARLHLHGEESSQIMLHETLSSNDTHTTCVPTQICSGAKDSRAEPEAARQFFEDSAAPDKTLHFEPDGYHQLLQDRPAVVQSTLKVVTQWILDHADH